MRGPAVKPVVIAAGGTGGHFFSRRGAGGRTFRARPPRCADDRCAFRRTAKRGICGPRAICSARRRHRRPRRGACGACGPQPRRRHDAGAPYSEKYRPAAIVGFGGYPCVAPVLAARTLRRRPLIVLQEQNAVLGRANRFLGRLADILALGVAGTSRVPNDIFTEITGNPVRPAIAALAGSGYTAPEQSIRLLVLGGSLGARVFSDVVPEALAALPTAMRERISVTQQCRAEDLPRVRDIYAQAGIPADLAPFFNDVAEKLHNAHLVIARAGASTCAELATAGRPAILVPLPSAIDDHQTANAGALARAGGARVIAQPDFTPAALAALLQDLFAHPDLLATAAREMAAIGRPAAAASLADLVERLVALAEARA